MSAGVITEVTTSERFNHLSAFTACIDPKYHARLVKTECATDRTKAWHGNSLSCQFYTALARGDTAAAAVCCRASCVLFAGCSDTGSSLQNILFHSRDTLHRIERSLASLGSGAAALVPGMPLKARVGGVLLLCVAVVFG